MIADGRAECSFPHLRKSANRVRISGTKRRGWKFRRYRDITNTEIRSKKN